MTKNGVIKFEISELKSFAEKFKGIKNEILSKCDLLSDITDKDISIFLFITKNFGAKIIYNIKYIAKFNKKFIINKFKKKFFLKQISLIFMFLYSKDKSSIIQNEQDTINYESKFKNIYKSFFSLMDNIYYSRNKNNGKNNTSLLGLSDINPIIQLNLLLGLNDLLNKKCIFNESILYFKKIYSLNKNNKNIFNFLKSIIPLLHANLSKSPKNLYFLKRDKDPSNFSILEITNLLIFPGIDQNLIDLIMETLNLIYKNNYSSNISDFILNKIKKGFYEMKPNNNKRITRCIHDIYGLMQFLDNLFKEEEKEKIDEYQPSSYFIFGGNEQSGIKYSPNTDLIKKNFTLIFSFKIKEIIDGVIYPIISYATFGSKSEIILNVSVFNKKLRFYTQADEKLREITEVSPNTFYLVVFEFKLSGILKGKLVVHVNNKKYEFYLGNINTKAKCLIKLGYIDKNMLYKKDKIFLDSQNFNGIIGTVMQFSNIFDDKNFIPNFFKMKGRYDMILFLNKNVNFEHYYYYEDNKHFLDEDIDTANKYFIDISKKISDNFQYSICPMAMINNSDQNTNFFKQDIYNKITKNNDKQTFTDFNTLLIPNTKSLATYAKKYQKSISIFVEYDGIGILNLIVEYFYNILKMLIDNPKEEKVDLAKDMYNVLSLVFSIIFKILKNFNLEYFSDSIDTFGFSIKKLFNLLVDIKPLDDTFKNAILDTGKQVIKYSKEFALIKSQEIINSFLNKIIFLIFSSKFMIISSYANTKLLIESIISLAKSHDLNNEDFIKGLLSFSYILTPDSFDKYNNRKQGTTIKSNNDYKKLKTEYKKLIIYVIKNTSSLKFYSYFLEEVMENQNSSWKEKYKLIKLYYRFHIVQSLYSSQDDSSSSIFNFLKRDKNNRKDNCSEKDILKDYQNYLVKLIDISESVSQKDEIIVELLKVLFILLIYEHKAMISLNFYNETDFNQKLKRNEKQSFRSEDSFIENINLLNNLSFNSTSFGSKLGKIEENEKNNEKLLSYSSAEEKDISNQSLDMQENKININREYYLFDSLLNSKTISFYIVRAFFSCLCDKLNKEEKIKFVKNIDSDSASTKDYITKFDRNKKLLLLQFIILIENINDEKVLESGMELIFEFLNNSLYSYLKDFNDKNAKSLFFHLFESKSIFNNFFHFCINSEVLKDEDFKNYIIDSIKYINQNLLLYHPKHYINSFIKNLIKYECPETFLIINHISSTFLEIMKSEDSNSNEIFFQNLVKFIYALLKAFRIYSNSSKKLLAKNKFELFYCIQNFVNELSQNDIYCDPNLYVSNTYIPSNKKENKKDEIIIQSSKLKLINKEIIYLYLVEIALNSIYLLWRSQDEDENIVKICYEYISKISIQMIISGDFVTYYLDLGNPYFNVNNRYLAKKIPENINNIINLDIKDIKKKNVNSLRETKIVSFSLFLLLVKYQSFFVNYEKSKNSEINEEKSIIKTFEPIFNLLEKEIQFLVPNIAKAQENKLLNELIEKEENKNEGFKYFNKNYYNYFIEKFKNQINDFAKIKEEIQNKFIIEENERIAISVNLLKNGNENNKINTSDSKSEKKEKIRKDSFGEYSFENDLKETKKKSISDNSKNNDNKNLSKSKAELLYFEDSKYPILCTKRDLILKTFGYFYYKYYFKDNKFIKLKKKFFRQISPSEEFNNYNGFEKIMEKSRYPLIIKNFSNNELYLPRIIYNPYLKFFENKYFQITHPYFENEKYEKTNKEKIMHLEYGHGLLNQQNFDLFSFSDKREINDEKNNNNKEKTDELNNDDSIFEKIENNMTPFTDDTLIKKTLTRGSSGKNNLYLGKKIIMTSNLNSKFECEKISNKNSNNGFLFFYKNFLIFQANTKFNKKEYSNDPTYLLSGSEFELNQNKKQIIIQFNLISQILYRKYLFFDIAIEIFLKNGKSYFFNFYNNYNKIQFIYVLQTKIKEEIIIKNSIEYFEKKKYTNKWLEGSITTLDYLLLLNKFSDRSYNVLSQYLLFPWLFNNYDNIYNFESIRNFNFPAIIQSKTELETVTSESDLDGYISHFTNFPSNYMYTNHYLFRSYPFLNNQIKLQDNALDFPARQFNSLTNNFAVFRENPKIFLESIPDFYFIPETFINLNCVFYGRVYYDNFSYLINNLGIGPNFQKILEFINYHKYYFDSENIISQLNKWIDYNFGENQLKSKEDTINNFPKVCYEKYIRDIIQEECEEIKSLNLLQAKEIDKQNLIAEKENIINEMKKASKNIKDYLWRSNDYGHCPTQLFTKSHPVFTKKIEPKIYDFTNMNNFHVILKNDFTKIDKADILYMHESSNGNYFYIICEHEILVYHKNLKMSKSLSINYIPNIQNFFSIKYHTSDNSFKRLYSYKFLIFDILDCKYFFIGGFMDNSLKIFFREKNKDVTYSTYVENQIKCLKNIEDEQSFFTGHENGKIIKWDYQINNDNNRINLIKNMSIRGHQSSVKMIELNKKYECIISVDEDEIILVRKLYNFELLSYIKLNKYNKKVIDINIYEQIIILTVFQIKTNQIFIYTYTLNGLNLGKLVEQLKLPITIIPYTDEMIIFTLNNIYLTKVSLTAKALLKTNLEDLDISYINLALGDDKNVASNFNKNFNLNETISYFYDNKNKVLFCLFSNGMLYRINFVKNA